MRFNQFYNKNTFLEIAALFPAFEAAGSGFVPHSPRLEAFRNQPRSLTSMPPGPLGPQFLFLQQQESVIPQKRWVAPEAQESSWVRVN